MAFNPFSWMRELMRAELRAVIHDTEFEVNVDISRIDSGSNRLIGRGGLLEGPIRVRAKTVKHPQAKRGKEKRRNG